MNHHHATSAQQPLRASQPERRCGNIAVGAATAASTTSPDQSRLEQDELVRGTLGLLRVQGRGGKSVIHVTLAMRLAAAVLPRDAKANNPCR